MMEIFTYQLVTESAPISRPELAEMAERSFGYMVKAVVDIKKEVMIVDAALHADEESLLLEKGSHQEDLWGINLLPERKDEDWIEFDSLINLRPRQENRSQGVDDPERRKKIVTVVSKLVGS